MTDEEIKALQDELEVAKRELEGLKVEKETLAGELAARDTGIATLEQTIADDSQKLDSVNMSLAQSVQSYKALVVQSNPEVVEELITGDTIEAINQSLESAKAVVSRVRKGMEAEIAAGKIPAGAPERTPLDLSSLSPREKIQYAITKGGR